MGAQSLSHGITRAVPMSLLTSSFTPFIFTYLRVLGVAKTLAWYQEEPRTGGGTSTCEPDFVSLGNCVPRIDCPIVQRIPAPYLWLSHAQLKLAERN